jgi:hypothetical protein
MSNILMIFYNNNVYFDLIMFWDFIGSLICKYCGFNCTFIFFFLLNTGLLVLIGGFDLLDINDSTHKYSFLQILYVSLVYLFLWISVSSTALLSQQKFSECFNILIKYLENLEQTKEEEYHQQDSSQNTNTKHIEKFTNQSNDIQKESTKTSKSDKLYFPILFFTIFIVFLINYIINRIIFKYKENYISKQTKFRNTDNVYIKIYRKEKYIFLLCICIPYFGEIIISFIIYLVFKTIFTNKNDKGKSIKNEEKKESGENLKIKTVSIKKICGYILINQTIIEREEKPENESSCLIIKCIQGCFESFILIFKSIKDCIKNSLCFCCLDNSSNCCNDNSPCCCYCYKDASFDQKEVEFYLYYKEKRKLKWFYDSINNAFHRVLILLIITIIYGKLLAIGFEVIYDERNIRKYNSSFNNMLFC